jgi:hypothetical protein
LTCRLPISMPKRRSSQPAHDVINANMVAACLSAPQSRPDSFTSHRN